MKWRGRKPLNKFMVLDFNKHEDNCFDVPRTIAICPYCEGSLSAQVTGWTENESDSNLYIANEVDLTCSEEPDIEDRSDWDDFVDCHSDMPYVHWLPVRCTVEDWINNNFRFISGGKF
jgi:hypothetical protein